jgi:hypothetical protein
MEDNQIWVSCFCILECQKQSQRVEGMLSASCLRTFDLALAENAVLLLLSCCFGYLEEQWQSNQMAKLPQIIQHIVRLP